ncbi:phospholipase [Vibrio rotiferianus]|uniref:phospholipase D family protein n=2 Tax=Vibrio rotiferianus TaxID=190895 RepID=UPI00110FFEB7|nr:phospholipase D family protein [Vibrio rotiferianus]TMX31713.1 phospholipase [Vibrio rotiferianus]TMX51338.1 phospholipase [Vibrio rotiferianus]TMX60336.1 phospholipase [Vibrio rotiferianus]
MTFTPYKQFALLVLTSMAMGCASSVPEVSSDFERSWQASHFKADAYLIPTAPEALARRIVMVREAQHSLDMTYFSWDKDTVGLMLLNEVKLAADRGVRVRLTLDDLLVFNEKWLAEVAQHEYIDIRIFNPFASRRMGWMGRSFDFVMQKQKRDHRLHEKYFNVDHQMMILGGRNIGNAYFGYSREGNFFDMDVLFRGDVIEAFADNYQSMWDSEFVTPIEEVIKAKPADDYPLFSQALSTAQQDREVVDAITDSIEKLVEAKFTSVMTTPVFDSTDKLLDNQPYFRRRLEHTLQVPLERAEHVMISTPYPIAIQGEFRVIDQLKEQGTSVSLVTNSLSSNDSAFIPAYYESYREQLLDSGVNIYEYKDRALNDDHHFHVQTYYHNKTVIVDSLQTYIGSSNFDPRSDFLNIEFGVVVESSQFAQQVHDYILNQKQGLFWRVERDDSNQTQWIAEESRVSESPNYGAEKAIPSWLFRQIPIELEL